MHFDSTDDILYNPERILGAIAKYRGVDLRKVSLGEVVEMFRGIFSIISLRTVNIDCYVFRVRKIEDNDPHDFIYKVRNPPSNSVTNMGRFNDVKESVFYAAFDPVTAIKEVRIQHGGFFSLSIFKLFASDNGVESTIHLLPRTNLEGLAVKQRVYTGIIDDFIYTEVTRLVAEGTEFQYKASCAVSKLLLGIPNKDSIIYPSMFDSQAKNIAITEQSVSKRLKLLEVHKCQYHQDDENLNPIISDYEVATALETSDELIYKPYHPEARNFTLNGSDFMKNCSILKYLRETEEAVRNTSI